MENRKNLKAYTTQILTTWSTNLKSIHPRKYRNSGYTNLGQPLRYLDIGTTKADLLCLPRLPHLKKSTACEKFPVGWNLYSLPETNLYKLVEIKFDNRLKTFNHWENNPENKVIGKFMSEFYKCLMMNFIEWKWDLTTPDYTVIHCTYKKVLGK